MLCGNGNTARGKERIELNVRRIIRLRIVIDCNACGVLCAFCALCSVGFSLVGRAVGQPQRLQTRAYGLVIHPSSMLLLGCVTQHTQHVHQHNAYATTPVCRCALENAIRNMCLNRQQQRVHYSHPMANGHRSSQRVISSNRWQCNGSCTRTLACMVPILLVLVLLGSVVVSPLLLQDKLHKAYVHAARCMNRRKAIKTELQPARQPAHMWYRISMAHRLLSSSFLARVSREVKLSV